MSQWILTFHTENTLCQLLFHCVPFLTVDLLPRQIMIWYTKYKAVITEFFIKSSNQTVSNTLRLYQSGMSCGQQNLQSTFNMKVLMKISGLIVFQRWLKSLGKTDWVKIYVAWERSTVLRISTSFLLHLYCRKNSLNFKTASFVWKIKTKEGTSGY